MENQLRDPIIAALLNLDKNDFIDITSTYYHLLRKTESTFLVSREILTEYNLVICTCAPNNKSS